MTMTWTSYNLPSSIVNASKLTSSFSYTPNRQYWQQVANYTNGPETTIYIGGLLEKVSNATSTYYRHMIKAGSATVIVSRATNGTNAVNYVTQDHLGSVSVVTDSTGTMVLNSSFGAYGARRGSNWQGTPSSADWTAIASSTRRGFTDHTMLDNVGVIHMNGRTYDPVIGRFMSADYHADRAGTSQGWNRYSYVHNNPMNGTDPSGFAFQLDNFDNYTTDQILAMSPDQMAALQQNEILNGQNLIAGAWQELAAEQVWQNMAGVGHSMDMLQADLIAFENAVNSETATWSTQVTVTVESGSKVTIECVDGSTSCLVDPPGPTAGQIGGVLGATNAVLGAGSGILDWLLLVAEDGAFEEAGALFTGPAEAAWAVFIVGGSAGAATFSTVATPVELAAYGINSNLIIPSAGHDTWTTATENEIFYQP
jgi:RHS repeat-associated protein